MGINIKAKTALYFSLVSNFLIIILFVIVPKVSAATGCFPDTNGHWAETFICWLSDNGIAGGYPDGTFRPENGVTRAELSVFLSNFNDNIGTGGGSGDYYTRAEVDALLAGFYTQSVVDVMLAAQTSRIADLETTLASVSLENSGNDFVFTNVNVHIRDGSGDTAGTVNGQGNLIIGYNEDLLTDSTRTGSHNLVVGAEHSYSSFGGFVAGYENTLSSPYASISGGFQNTASDWYTSVSGGANNTASGLYSAVSGGRNNTASALYAPSTGGDSNTADADYETVSGGYNNTASGVEASVSGGKLNTASGNWSSVSGGDSNTASDQESSVSGGSNNEANGSEAAILGGDQNTASGVQAVVAGGEYNTSNGTSSSVSGSRNNLASGYGSAVSGGGGRKHCNRWE